MGNPLTTNNAAENVDENAFDVRIFQQDPESSRHCFFGRATADVQEVCRLAAGQLDDIHRRHRQTCAVHHAADVTIKLNIVEIIFSRFNLERIFFVEVAHLLHIGVPEQRVIVERHLAVQRDQFLVGSDDQRVDLYHRRVLLHKQAIQVPQHLNEGIHDGRLHSRKPESEGHVPPVVRLKPDSRIDRFPDDLLRLVSGNFFDLHPTFGACNKHRPAAIPIDEEAHVQFLGNRSPFFDQ